MQALLRDPSLLARSLTAFGMTAGLDGFDIMLQFRSEVRPRFGLLVYRSCQPRALR
jgi:hypothetical protein